ncbi:acetyltransferase [Paralimibaculum aggregatum]|nr:acetyltransferase [Limibaculum sp. NKW23]
MDLAIFGGRGGGEVMAETARALGAQGPAVIGFLNDEVPRGARIGVYPVLGSFADWPALPAAVQFIAPLHKVRQMPRRAARIEGLGIPDPRWARLVDGRSAVAAGVTLGVGSLVGPHAEIQAGTHLGRHVAVRGSGYVGHDVAIGDFAFIGARAVVCGYCRIGEGAHLAPGALIREGVRIGRFAVVGLGAVVLRDVEDYAVVAGNPARRIGDVPAAEADR